LVSCSRLLARLAAMASSTIAHAHLAALRLAVMCVVVVPSSAVVSNPTGTCKTNGNGARPGYSPGTDATYLPDCSAPLSHEYWRVFAVSNSSAFVIPRIDDFGVAIKYGMCDGENEMASLLKKYSMCKEVLNSDDVKLINNMKPADALSITHALHEQLCFKAQGTSIIPWGPDDDIHEVCGKTTDAGAASYCSQIKKRIECLASGGPCNAMAIAPSESAVKIIVPGLNKLYGTSCAGSSGVSAAPLQFNVCSTFVFVIGILAYLYEMLFHV